MNGFPDDECKGYFQRDKPKYFKVLDSFHTMRSSPQELIILE
jgi:hypothetical protein